MMDAQFQQAVPTQIQKHIRDAIEISRTLAEEIEEPDRKQDVEKFLDKLTVLLRIWRKDFWETYGLNEME